MADDPVALDKIVLKKRKESDKSINLEEVEKDLNESVEKSRALQE